MKFSIQRKSIRAMLHLAAKKDIRYYLQGINVVRDNRGTYIEATDGHVLGRLLIDGIRSDSKQNVVLPTDALLKLKGTKKQGDECIRSDSKQNVVLPTDALLKLKGTKKQGDEWLHFEVNGLSVECIQGDSTIRFSAHDARFPDTDRVIPLVFKPEDNAAGTFNPDLLVRFVDVSEELYGKRQVPMVLQRGTQSAIVAFPQMDDAFIGVIMPTKEYAPAKVPSWCYTPSVKPLEVPENV